MTPYPGTPLRKNSLQPVDIKAIQAELERLGLGNGFSSGQFDSQMESAVKVFQSRNVDAAGHALKVDGIVGSFTWGALFGFPAIPLSSSLASPLPALALATASSQIGVMEIAGQPNRGLQVDVYLKASGIANPGNNPPGGYPWCQAFVYWCFVQAGNALARAVPAPKTAGVLEHWNLATPATKVKRVTKAAAQANFGLVQTGMLFVNDYGGGHGHIGFVERVFPDGRLVTVEGNTNALANAEGLGVFRLERRKINDKELKGFLDYSAA